MFPSFAELQRQKARIEAEIAAARGAGDEEGVWEGIKQFNCIDEQIDLYPERAARMIDAAIADCGDDPVLIRAQLKHAIAAMERGRLEALTRGDQVGAERATEGGEFLAKRLAQLSRELH